MQSEMAQNLIEQQNMQMIQAQAAAQAAINAQMQQNQGEKQPSGTNPININEELNELSMDFNDIDENIAVEKLKNWIETN